MTLRSFSIVLPLTLAAALAGFSGCAGSHSSSSQGGSSHSKGDDNAQKLEDARRSAEDAEMKAHQMREEKNRTQSKTSSSN